MSRLRQPILAALILALISTAPHARQASPPTKGGINSIEPASLKEWLTYIASDELEGRNTFSEGLGLAAGYISAHLAQWGVKPAGDRGTYLQVVRVLGIRSTSRASVTVDVNGQSRTFKDGEAITFPKNMGGKQTITGDQIQFAGYGLTLPDGEVDDYAKVDPKGKVVVWLGPQGPKTSASGLVPAAEPGCAQSIRSREGRARGDRAGGRRVRRTRTRHRAGGSGGGRDATWRRPPRRAGRWRFHDGAALRHQGASSRHRRGRVLRVPVQRIGGEVRRR